MKNKGFTLIELLVAVAIFSIVFSTATALMIVGARTFTRGNADADIQREAQLAVDQIEDMIIDTNYGVDYVETAETKELIFYNQLPDGTYTKESVKWSKTTQEIRYSKWQVSIDPVTNSIVVGSEIVKDELLAKNVSDFLADLSDTIDQYTEDGEIRKVVQSVQISAEYKDENGMSSYATTPVITLRNRLLVGNEKIIFDKPEPPAPDATLSVKVKVLNSEFNQSAACYEFPCRGTVVANGFIDGELEYVWRTDRDWATISDSSPDGCTVVVSTAAAVAHADEWFTVYLRVTPTKTISCPAQEGFDKGQVPPLGDYGDSSFERGAVDDRNHYYIPNYNIYNVDLNQKEEIVFKDADGNLYPNQEELAQHIWIEKEQGGFKFGIREGLNPAYEYFITITVIGTRQLNVLDPKTNNWVIEQKELSRTFYVPATQIISASPVCPWKGIDTKYGKGSTGDGIRYEVKGYLRELWKDNSIAQKVKITTDTVDAEGLKAGHRIEVVPDFASTTTDHKTEDDGNMIRTPFSLRIVDKNGKDVTNTYNNKDKKKIKVKSAKVKVEFEGISGYVPITFN